VQEVEPSARVVYVDNDPIVLAHAAALMVSDPRGATAYLQADARDPRRILASPELRGTLDLDRPVGVSALAILPFLDDAAATDLVGSLMAAVPSGSHLVLTHSTVDFDTSGAVAEAVENYRRAGMDSHMRSHDEIVRLFFDGLEILEPGLVPTHRWRADAGTGGGPSDSDVSMYGAVAVKP
jgi:O-methyltransferase involved in polyketide biosynthesis